MPSFRLFSFILAFLCLAACGKGAEQSYPELVTRDTYSTNPDDIQSAKDNRLFAEGAAVDSFLKSMTGDSSSKSQTAGKDALFKAAVETLSFMPLISADADNGIVITDWYALPEDPTIRYKVNVIAGDQKSLSVSAFKQTKSGPLWKDAAVPAGFSDAIKGRILARAAAFEAAKKGKRP